jgi:hypothetical protein
MALALLAFYLCLFVTVRVYFRLHAETGLVRSTHEHRRLIIFHRKSIPQIACRSGDHEQHEDERKFPALCLQRPDFVLSEPSANVSSATNAN